MNDNLYHAIQAQPISDTHEHIISSSTLVDNRRGLIEFINESYLHDDIISSGGSQELFSSGSDSERWRQLSPFLERVRNTTYYRCLIGALNDLFGFEFAEIDDSNWEECNDRLLDAAVQGESWYEHVLWKKANIVHCMLDQDRTTDTEVSLWSDKGLKNVRDNIFEQRFFLRVSRTDLLLYIIYPEARKEIEEIYQLKLADIDDVDELVLRFATKADEQKSVAYKSVAAYFRTLTIKEPSRDNAAVCYARILGGSADESDRLSVQNYILGRLLAAAAQRDMPFQFHTGMQAANGNIIDNSNVLRLNTIFMQYPEVRFVMLHGGYPFHAVAGVMAKKFPNVYLDCSWLPQIGFAASVHAMNEWLDLVPMSKITWGGDCRHVENSYSAVLLLRKLLYDVLDGKIKNGYLNQETAFKIAESIMFKNAKRIYGL